MKKLLLILLCFPVIGFGQVTKNKSTFNFKKTNNYSKTYTYDSDTTDYYTIIEVIDWDAIALGTDPEEAKAFKKTYFFKNKKLELKKAIKEKNISIGISPETGDLIKVDWNMIK